MDLIDAYYNNPKFQLCRVMRRIGKHLEEDEKTQQNIVTTAKWENDKIYLVASRVLNCIPRVTWVHPALKPLGIKFDELPPQRSGCQHGFPRCHPFAGFYLVVDGGVDHFMISIEKRD